MGAPGRTRRERPALAARRTGYAVSLLFGTVLLWLVNVDPGWQAVPFLTADAATVLGAVNASIVSGIAANLAFLVVDPPWFKALGDVVVTTVGLVALAALWRTFPFSLGTDPVDWTRVVRVVLVVSIAGSVVAVVVGLVELVRSVVLPRTAAGDAGART